MDSWIYKKLYNNKQIENFSLNDCVNFIKLESTSLFIHDYDILCVGYKNNVKQFYQLKILASSPKSKMLQGPHELIVYDQNHQSQFWVLSLTTLRKYFFEFSDRLSFERSAFIVLKKSQVLLRLQCVRSILKIMRKIPHQIQKKISFNRDIFTIPYNSNFIQPYHKVGNSGVSKRIKEQQQNLLEKSYTSYLREFENTQFTKGEIFEKFKKDILVNLDKLNDTLVPTPIEEVPLEMVVKQLETRDNVSVASTLSDFSFELHEIDFCC